MSHAHWPLFDLRLITDRLVLRPPTDGDLPALTDLVVAGIHDPATMPFEHEWTDQASPQLERGVSQWAWRLRGLLCPAAWALGFIVERRDGGEPIGVQDLLATEFPVRHTVETGSWLGLAHQGLGYGKEMRSAVLHLAFSGLGAEVAETGAWDDNLASIGVTRALGYRDNGEAVSTRRGLSYRQLRFRLSRSRWSSTVRPDVSMEGLEGTRRLLGLVDGDGGAPGAG
jgi:RimJ/RimL family protein N-acetyltransferase